MQGSTLPKGRIEDNQEKSMIKLGTCTFATSDLRGGRVVQDQVARLSKEGVVEKIQQEGTIRHARGGACGSSLKLVLSLGMLWKAQGLALYHRWPLEQR